VNSVYRVSLIIPAYNEASTVGEVLRAAVEAGIFSEIILVDDGSKDGTGAVFERTRESLLAETEPGVVPPQMKLVTHPKNLGKALAMRDGLRLATGEIAMFIDADLVGLKPSHLRSMLEPLTDESDYSASLGVFVGGRMATTMAQKIAPFISGQRACFHEDLAGFTAWERVGFGVETALNRYLQENGIKVRVVELEDLTHRMKEEKRGAVRGFGARMKMYWEILCVWARSKFTRNSRKSV
jgi:glycosyltransferase involved in cell wall biosynthesis